MHSNAIDIGYPARLRCRFKNSSAAQQLKLVQSRPRMLPAVARLISLPVIIFGPGIGVPAAILMFGVNTPNAIKHANRIRRWSAWVRLHEWRRNSWGVALHAATCDACMPWWFRTACSAWTSSVMWCAAVLSDASRCSAKHCTVSSGASQPPRPLDPTFAHLSPNCPGHPGDRIKQP